MALKGRRHETRRRETREACTALSCEHVSAPPDIGPALFRLQISFVLLTTCARPRDEVDPVMPDSTDPDAADAADRLGFQTDDHFPSK